MSSKQKTYPKLSGNLSVDVAIIGGGLAGISSAYMISKTKKSVAVLEAKTVGSGVTSKTTSFITKSIDTSLSELVSMYGAKGARMVWESGQTAIETMEEIVKKEKIDCDFMRCPLYTYAASEHQLKSIAEDYEQAKKLGFAVKLHKSNNMPFKTFGYLEIKNQAKFSCAKYIQGLSAAASKKGAKIFENTEVTKISGKGPFKLKTPKGIITAKQIIIATYDPLGNPKETHFKKGMYRSYVFYLEIPKNKLPKAMFVDAHNPYHYFRIDKNNAKADSMIFGGEDHRNELKMDPKKNFKALKEYLDKTFPKMKYKIKSQWSGPILEPTDGLPLIGKFRPNQFVAAAFSGNGMTYSTIAALIFQKQILGQNHPWQKLYGPTRIPSLKQLVNKSIDYTGEFFGAAAKNIFK